MALHADSRLIDELGGPQELARVFEISPQAVSMWRTSGIPKARRMYLQLARPDVFSAEKAGRAASPDTECARDQRGTHAV